VTAATTAPSSLRWSVVVPVKELRLAKSRLNGLSAERRAQLALAMAADTVTAAIAAERVADVLVVTADKRVEPALKGLGAQLVDDEPDAGLNPALTHAARIAAARRPDHGLAALAADLPSLTPAALDAALAAASQHPVSFVADTTGQGTTMLCVLPRAPFRPQFGAGSARRHLAAGAIALDVATLDGLRRDVDVPADLRHARKLGVGRRTASLLKGSAP
jgi:2-phospho-L-lactate guanylyltransferase